MSISDLIKNKSASDQARVESLRAERGNLSDLRDAALEEITTRPELYQKFLDLQADNISCSAGNVALTMFQMDGATRIGTISFWHEQGRYVREESMKDGAKVFVPARISQRRVCSSPSKSGAERRVRSITFWVTSSASAGWPTQLRATR